MTRKIGFLLAAMAALAVSLVDVSDAQAWGRRNHGSCGGWNGGGGGSHGGGSFGGFFRRNGGSWGGNGSHGGYHNGCGSHGGSYQNGNEAGDQAYYGEGEVRSAQRQRETRYYGQRNGRDTAVPAPGPVYIENGQRSDERREMDRREDQAPDAAQQQDSSDSENRNNGADQGQNLDPPAPPTPGDQAQGADQSGNQNRGDNSSTSEQDDANKANTTGIESGAGT